MNQGLLFCVDMVEVVLLVCLVGRISALVLKPISPILKITSRPRRHSFRAPHIYPFEIKAGFLTHIYLLQALTTYYMKAGCEQSNTPSEDHFNTDTIWVSSQTKPRPF